MGVANMPKKWIWNIPDDSSQNSMGIIQVPLTENMMCRPHGTPLLCLAAMAEWNRLATVRPNGLIEWRLMRQTMVPLVQANASGLTTTRSGTSCMKIMKDNDILEFSDYSFRCREYIDPWS